MADRPRPLTEKLLRIVGLELKALDPIVHVHSWVSAPAETYDSWLLGPVQVLREYCRCNTEQMAVIHQGRTTAFENTKTREQVRQANEAYLAPQTRLSRRALATRSLHLSSAHARYGAYCKAQQGSLSEHQRFDSTLTIVMSLHENVDTGFRSYRSTVKEAFDVAVDLMNEIDVVELALFGRSPALLSRETFERLVDEARAKMQANVPPEPELDSEAVRGPGRLHWHRWRPVHSQRLYSPEYCCEVDVERKACRCGAEREVVSMDMPLGVSRVLQIRPID